MNAAAASDFAAARARARGAGAHWVPPRHAILSGLDDVLPRAMGRRHIATSMQLYAGDSATRR